MHALIIDDSRTTRMILRQILNEIGFTVAEAGNGREGLERLRQLGLPDAVLVDWNMPEMNGVEFVRAVRADAAYRDLPLMMVTTANELDQVSEALEAGASEFVMKPFTREVIAEKLALLGLAVG